MANVEKYLDSHGELTRDDFVKVAQDHKLLELNERQAVTGWFVFNITRFLHLYWLFLKETKVMGIEELLSKPINKA